eukprot:CAMPEP_0184556528 /NCGR_PEP_ID=MMETSP0199_2-20130426/40436_1 /TAXON_ID=1112570 /ORGANISM="Thraustochytrium sp., Strain LLF1b" /LENGTH=35 /DNA_ID= /DNA_START= /DNA_END= /DNA_ORIENTATION=
MRNLRGCVTSFHPAAENTAEPPTVVLLRPPGVYTR